MRDCGLILHEDESEDGSEFCVVFVDDSMQADSEGVRLVDKGLNREVSRPVL